MTEVVDALAVEDIEDAESGTGRSLYDGQAEGVNTHHSLFNLFPTLPCDTVSS